MEHVSSGRDVVPWFGPGIRAARDRQGWTARELGEHAGTTGAVVSLVETGKRAPSLRLALRLCDALGVSVDSLRPPA